MLFGLAGDVLSGTLSEGVHHSGVMEEWFGYHWWTKRWFLLLLTTLFIFAPLVSFKRVGECMLLFMLNVVLMLGSHRGEITFIAT